MQADGEVGKVGKWVTHYCSDHKILLVGEGDFSFSLSLARSFGSASNIVASSLDSYDDVTKKFKDAKSNLDDLQKLGACLLHEVDATKMKLHSYLEARRFHRIIFNFPHAGFHGKEDDSTMIEMHKNLVLGFFENASCLLRFSGEIHVNHKTNAPFSYWNIEELAIQSFLTLIECVDFRKEDYPGYKNKRGDSDRCDKPFPLGKCTTFKFIYKGRHKMINHVTYRQHPSFQEIQEAVENLPTSVDLSYYPQTNHVSRLNEAVSSTFGHIPNSGSCLNNEALDHERVAPCANYFAHEKMMSKRDLSRLLHGVRPGSYMRSKQEASPTKTTSVSFRFRRPTQEAPPAKISRTTREDGVTTGTSSVVAAGPIKDKGKGSVTASKWTPVKVEGGSLAYASPTISGVDIPIPTPASVDAQLLDETCSEYLKGFSPMSLIKQMKGMAVYSASILKFFESGGAWDEAVQLEKDKLPAQADKKVRDFQALYAKKLVEVKKSLAEANKQVDEATRALGEKNQQATILSFELAAAKEEARLAKVRAAKAEEDLVVKIKELGIVKAKLVAETTAKDKCLEAIQQAAVNSWENALDQLHLGHPEMDFSWLAIDGFVEEGALLRYDDENNIVKLLFPGSSSK